MVAVSEIIVAFGLMLGLMPVGVPIAVVMVLIGVVGGLLTFGWPLVQSMGPVVWGTLNENILTAIPLFILLGQLLLRSGIADKMYGALSLSLWFAGLPGGLLHTNVGCSALFAATSGSSVATAATIGTVALPALNERGYPKSQALGSLTNTSIGQLFIVGIVPGILLTLVFMAWIVVANLGEVAYRPEARVAWGDRLRALVHLLPPLVIFAIVMGSIYLGVATPTESAALGVVVALACVWRAGRLDLAFLQRCFVQTARTSGMVLLIIVGAFMLIVTLSLVGVAQTMTAWVASLGLSPTGLLLVLVVFYLLLGMFMDVLSMQVLTIPITVPIVVAAGIDPIWFGVFIVLMCELGLITPPVGMNLYVVQGVRPDRGNFPKSCGVLCPTPSSCWLSPGCSSPCPNWRSGCRALCWALERARRSVAARRLCARRSAAAARGLAGRAARPGARSHRAPEPLHQRLRRAERDGAGRGRGE